MKINMKSNQKLAPNLASPSAVSSSVMLFKRVASRIILWFKAHLVGLGLFLAVLILLIGVNNWQLRQFRWVKLGDNRYLVVIARSPQARTQGLSDRTDIGAQGMLFIQPQTARHIFWMNRMKMPLDFIWLKDDQVVDLHQNVPTPVELGEIARVQPGEPASYVLEVPSGFIEREQVEIGTRFTILPIWYLAFW